MRLNLLGESSGVYVLDRTLNLSPAAWLPQATNAAAPDGSLIFDASPQAGTNNFWRVRWAP